MSSHAREYAFHVQLALDPCLMHKRVGCTSVNAMSGIAIQVEARV